MSREEFLKYGRDLEASKGKDMDRYYDVERQIKDSYRRCGEVTLQLCFFFVASSSGGCSVWWKAACVCVIKRVMPNLFS